MNHHPLQSMTICVCLLLALASVLHASASPSSIDENAQSDRAGIILDSAIELHSVAPNMSARSGGVAISQAVMQTQVASPGQSEPSLWSVHLPLIVRAPEDAPPSTPTATSIPEATVTATPTATSIPEPTVTATPSPPPEPELPAQVRRYAFGTDFNNTTDCEISDPLPWPIVYPPGTTQIAFQVVFDVSTFQSFSARIDKSFGGTILAASCNKYTVVGGRPRQSQLGVTISRVGGSPLPPGTYQLEVSFDGSSQPALVVPFEIR